MTEHLSTETLERFHQNTLTTMDRSLIYDHVLSCEECRKQIVFPEIEAVALENLCSDLLSEGKQDSLHLDYETIESYVDESLDTSARNQTAAHLNMCSTCSAEVSDFRESLAAMTNTAVILGKDRVSVGHKIRSFVRTPFFASPLRVSIVVGFMILLAITVAVVRRLTSTNPAAIGNRQVTAGVNPTPAESPSNAISPLPTPGPSPHSTPSPSNGAAKRTQELLALNDGPNRIILDNSGKVTGLESLPLETQRSVREVLLANKIDKPEILDQLRVADVSLRAPSGEDEQVRVIYPSSTVITEDTPRLEWSPAKGATGYRIEIGDANYHQVAKSEDLSATTRRWIPPTPLRRGGVYTWIVRASRSDGTVWTSQAKFKVLSDAKRDKLTHLRTTTTSRLALGVFYAREGMVPEAEREFQALAKENPHSATARSLLNQIRSWQKPLN